MGAEQSRSRSRHHSNTNHGTRGWSRDEPKTVGERSAVLSKCGRRCFLGPGNTFPICARLGSGSKAGSEAEAESISTLDHKCEEIQERKRVLCNEFLCGGV